MEENKPSTKIGVIGAGLLVNTAINSVHNEEIGKELIVIDTIPIKPLPKDLPKIELITLPQDGKSKRRERRKSKRKRK
jgi:hypothetical protein